MKIHCRWLKSCLLAAFFLSASVHAEDIDIFTGTTEVNTSLPNVVFVLDNTSNWSRASQKWPGGLVQGQSEVKAIKTALAAQVGKLNVGIMEYITGGSSATTDAGYTRFNLQELNATSLVALNDTLDTIYGDINGPTEKRSSSNPYGYLPWDFYNYLSGSAHSKAGAGNTGGHADPAAYDTVHSDFRSPLGAADACADTYMIFIGNNANGSVAGDDSTNTAALKALYTAAGATVPNALAGDTGTPLAMPGFACTAVTTPGEIITPAVPAYCDPPVTVPGAFHPAQSFPLINNVSSTACWKNPTYDAAAATSCTTAENGGSGICAGRTAGNCSCTTVKTSPGWNIPAGCSPTSSPTKNRTFRWNVYGAAYTVAAYTDPDTTTQQCYPAVPEVRGPDVISDVCATTGLTDTTGGTDYNFDDWAKFLHNYGIPLTVTVDDVTYSERVKVTTYAIDVFNAQQSAALSSVWFSAANAGGGRYFQAKSEDQIIAAINSSLGDILAVSSSFAAVSLPLSATNRARVDNQVYIGMFRPALGKEPRWFGNLKRYQLALFDDVPRLADVKLKSAVNPLTGFVTECAESFWSEDTGTYWEDLGVNPAPLSECIDVDVTTSKWSDLPDGPFVEKGGMAQQTRQGPAGDARTIYTVESDTGLRALASADATALGGTTVLDYLRGDEPGAGELMALDGLGEDLGLRPSIHGDVVHSRPLSVRHSADDVTLYYGANDGVYRAVNAADGTERWALVAPEHFSKIQRLYDNSPLIRYTGAEETGSVLKDYFFDGATGQLTVYDDAGALELAYIYPTQRRGGRMVYALDVTDADAAPDLLWRVGCEDLDNDSACTGGFSDIGQTWSMPVGGYTEGYVDGSSNPKLIVAFGGGFDDCLNEDAAAYPSSCSSAKGKGVYILDAAAGTLLAHLDTDAPVISELSVIDINFDGYMDFAYAADVAGDLYRVNFATMNDADPAAGLTALAKENWTIVKIGSTADNERRFYNAPTAAAFQGTVLVTVGSGDRERPLEINYPFAADVQNRFYAFFDEPFKTFVASPVGDLEVDEATTVDLDGSTMLAVVELDDDDVVPDLTEYDGWYMDIPDRGEQVANPSAIGGGKVFFNTFQPGGVSDGLCERPLGIGTGYAINAFGPEFTEGNEIEGPGIPIPPVIATVRMPDAAELIEQYCDGPDCRPFCEGDVCSCEGTDCKVPPTGTKPPLEIRTVCIGCEGFEPIEIIPSAPPVRRRVFFTEDIDRTE